MVTGFHGFGGRDISPHALWVYDGDVLGFAQTVERILTSWGNGGGALVAD